MVDDGFVDFGVCEDGLLGKIDWDNVVLNFDEVDDFELFGDELSNPSPPLSISDIEQFLMDDEHDDALKDCTLDPVNAFLDDVLVDSPDEEHDGALKDCTFEPTSVFLEDVLLDSPVEDSEGVCAKGDCSSSVVSEDGEQKFEDVSPMSENGEKMFKDVSPQEDEVGDKEEDVDEDHDDDPLTKKRKRQLRNRDAAVRSRERKKEYVRDLEMKSKYFEAECRRLGMLLQCCLAENHALRLSMQNTMTVDASRTKQESAVLVMESLLLGSLLWFLGIICLLILPSQLYATPKEVQLGKGESGSQGNLFPRKGSSEILRNRILQSFMMGKSCKASRSRMKLEVEAQVIRCIS
ncbi:hypothetical protein Leryth_000289 [Lithospermum erythrorhizon]|nr:hypothetical protein Leryth_000289 [Lithospermum erythrorhizon]